MLEKIIMQQSFASLFILAVVGNFTVASNVREVSHSALNVTINGLKNERGQVCLSLFSSRQGFPSSTDSAVEARCVKVSATPLTVRFQKLKVGSYAVAVFHDANSDGTLNGNGLGIPTEEFGFSQNPTILVGSPKFGDAAVLVVGPETNIQIQLQYFGG